MTFKQNYAPFSIIFKVTTSGRRVAAGSGGLASKAGGEGGRAMDACRSLPPFAAPGQPQPLLPASPSLPSPDNRHQHTSPSVTGLKLRLHYTLTINRCSIQNLAPFPCVLAWCNMLHLTFTHTPWWYGILQTLLWIILHTRSPLCNDSTPLALQPRHNLMIFPPASLVTLTTTPITLTTSLKITITTVITTMSTTVICWKGSCKWTKKNIKALHLEFSTSTFLERN